MPIVAIEKYGPRKRKHGIPTPSEKMAASAAATGIVAHGDQPAVHRIAVVYAPMPRNAACPNETCPAKPPRMFQAELIAPYRKIKKKISSVYSARGARNGSATAASSATAGIALATGPRSEQTGDAPGEGDEHDDQHDERDQILQ